MNQVDAAEARRRKLMMLCKEIGLTRDERHELASYMLRRDVTTYSGLDDTQISRLLDAAEGYQLIDVLLSLRPARVSADGEATGSRTPG